MSDRSRPQADPYDGLDVSRETIERLAAFTALLRKWNARINLVARGDLADLERRHVLDSLQLLRLLPADTPLVDLGSGAGFPGLVLGLAGSRHVTLVEADQRKAAFLHEAARVTGTRATIVAARIERCGITDARVITARALAPLDRLLGLALPLLASDGVCLFPKGEGVEAELTDAERQWQMQVVRHPTRHGGAGSILEVRHLRPVHRDPG